MGPIWTPEQEAEKLAERFKTLNKAAFAREHQVPGGASMLNQHTKGHRPIGLEAAIAYARGFKVPLEEISPRLALQVRQALELSGDEAPQVPPTVEACVKSLAAELMSVSAITRRAAGQLLAGLAESPESADEIASQLTALLTSTRRQPQGALRLAHSAAEHADEPVVGAVEETVAASRRKDLKRESDKDR